MKILFIHNKYIQFGGEDVAVEQEMALLSAKGHNVKILFFENENITGIISKIKAAFQAIYNFSSARKVKKAIKEFNPDIIHVHNLFFIASPSVLYAASRKKIPVILTLHNYRLICSNALLLRDNKVCELCIQKKFPLSGIRYKCYRNTRAGSTLVTLITGVHKLLNTWKKKVTTYTVSNEFSRVRLLNSSLQLPEHKLVAKANFISDPGEGKVPREDFYLFAGRIAKEKGAHMLLEAFAGLPNRKLVLVGDGPEKEYLKNQFKSYDNIHFTGQLQKPDVLEYMKRCKALICPSVWYEVTPFTNLEAFATGTPVIASRLGSMKETIKDGYNGLHFTAGDPEDLKNKVELFMQITDHNNDLYKNARESYLQKYHPDVHYRSIIRIYEQAINNYSDQ